MLSLYIFTSQALVLLLLINALTLFELQTGAMQLNRSDQPPNRLPKKLHSEYNPIYMHDADLSYS